MKIATLNYEGAPRLGLLSDDEALIHIAPSGWSYLETVLAGDRVSELADACRGSGLTIQTDQAELLPVVTAPKRIVCIGRNYPKIHPVDGELPPPTDIGLFMKVKSPSLLAKKPASWTRKMPGRLWPALRP